MRSVKDWVIKRLEAAMDHIVGGVALIGVLALAGLIVAFGGKHISVEGWEAVMLALILAGLATGVGLSLRNVRRVETLVSTPVVPLRAHAALLASVEDLERNLKGVTGQVSWHIANRYNELLRRARAECASADFSGLEPITRTVIPEIAAIDQVGLRGVLGQLRSIIEYN